MNVTVIGLGLVGGSVLRALAAAGHHVVGHDADPATRATAHAANGVIAIQASLPETLRRPRLGVTISPPMADVDAVISNLPCSTPAHPSS